MVFFNVEKEVNNILSNRKNSNNISKILNVLQTDESQQTNCIQGVEKLLTTFLQRKDFNVVDSLRVTDEKKWLAEVQYVKWLEETYEKSLKVLYECLESKKRDVAQQALSSLMNVISFEKNYALPKKKNGGEKSSSFPESRLYEILKVLLSPNIRTSDLIIWFEKYVRYKDIFFYTWKILKKVVPSIKNSNDTFMLNILELIEKIPIPKASKTNVESSESANDEIFCRTEGAGKFVINMDQVKIYMTKVWHSLVNRNISPVVHRKLMLILLEHFLVKLDNPICLTDFFMASSTMGGANALLAMQGILTLVQKFNIEYPNIYGKLYSMFEPNIFHTKYKSRLFYLANIFLCSSHLPENLVAAFAKRVARLSLTAQVPDIIVSMQFIQNLILRHPGLKKLILHPDGGQVFEDPFLPSESDPAKSRAIDSCLWEVVLLKNHVQPSVSSAVNFADGSLPKIEFDLDEVLDLSTEELINKEAKHKHKISLSMSRPEKIAKIADDRVYKLWSLT